MSLIIEKIPQYWDIKICNQKKHAPYLVVDNWYTPKELKDVWTELELYNSLSEQDREKATDEGVAVAKTKGEALSNAYRFHLWDFYTQKGRNMSAIIRAQYKFRSKEFHDLVQEAMPLHHNNFINTNYDNTFVGYYDKGKYYKPHHDSVQFTALIWLYKEPKQFFGGNTKICPINATIDCIPNRMLFFPSYLQHEVPEVKSKNDIEFGYGRYGITHFYNWR